MALLAVEVIGWGREERKRLLNVIFPRSNLPFSQIPDKKMFAQACMDKE
jgi:hypothetical protein